MTQFYTMYSITIIIIKQVLILDPTVGDPSPPVSWAFLIVGGSPHHEGYMHFE